LTGVTTNTTSSFAHHTTFTDIGGLVAVNNVLELPEHTRLLDNYPNPFNPVTTIRYELVEASHINLDVYDMRGNHIADLDYGYKASGQHEIMWNGQNQNGAPVSAGVYIYTLRTRDGQDSKRMILLK